MMEPKPIDYAGNHFKSTLEARWAVLFSMLDWEWKYEPRKFDLGDIRYIPDFLIGRRYYEVKPQQMPNVNGAFYKCECLARHLEEPVFLIMGNPWPSKYYILKFDPNLVAELFYFAYDGMRPSPEDHSTIEMAKAFFAAWAVSFEDGEAFWRYERKEPDWGEGLITNIKWCYDILDAFPGARATGRGWYIACCPFHEDRHPSFWIDTERGLCGCFACCTEKPMDVIDLRARLDGVSNEEAIFRMRDEIGWV